MAVTGVIFLMALLAGGLLWHRRRRIRTAEMHASGNVQMYARSSMALTDWPHSSSKAIVTSSGPDDVRTSRHSRLAAFQP